MAFIGIDPGGSGAFSLVYKREIDVVDWTGLDDAVLQLETWLMLYPIHSAAIEEVHARVYLKRGANGRVTAQSQKGSSNFKFGMNFGMWQGMLKALGVPYELVPPSVWMGSYNLRKKNSKSDKPALDLARDKYPGVDLRFKKHHDRAESLLIAAWLRDKHTIKLP